MLYLLTLLGAFLFGLILLVIGAILLLKVKNKLAGWLVAAVGVVFTLVPLLIFLGMVITRRVQG